jgi:hypothetical protein
MMCPTQKVELQTIKAGFLQLMVKNIGYDLKAPIIKIKFILTQKLYRSFTI